jgi:FkbM family methyltransferase
MLKDSLAEGRKKKMKKIVKELYALKRKKATWLSLITKKISGKYTEGFFVQTGDFRFIVGSEDMSVGRTLRKKGIYGDDELKRISKLISTDSVVIFVGTHIGALAIPTARRVKSCVFVEANPQTFSFLSMNVSLNNVTNARCINVAVGEEEGEINFVLSTVNSGGSKREPVVKDEMYYYDKPNTISVPMVTLDSICSDEAEMFDLVFMDIEGSEFFALKGMHTVLNRTKALIIEFIPHHLLNVANCSAGEFIGLISKYFNYCYVPSKDAYLEVNEFAEFFSKMFALGEADDGLVFTNEPVRFK